MAGTDQDNLGLLSSLSSWMSAPSPWHVLGGPSTTHQLLFACFEPQNHSSETAAEAGAHGQSQDLDLLCACKGWVSNPNFLYNVWVLLVMYE